MKIKDSYPVLVLTDFMVKVIAEDLGVEVKEGSIFWGSRVHIVKGSLPNFMNVKDNHV